MLQSIIISSRVQQTIKSLPESERAAITQALTADLILGQSVETLLSPFQAMLYSVIRYYVKRDSERKAAGLPFDGFSRERSFRTSISL
ncbi:MAG: hypothetical protein NC338_06740 [Firmicutes bacterium]|nr:hypothetical protein [Bacillota bacterium]